MYNVFDCLLIDFEMWVGFNIVFVVFFDYGYFVILVYKFVLQYCYGLLGVFFVWGGLIWKGVVVLDVYVFDIVLMVLYFLGFLVFEDVLGCVLIEFFEDLFNQCFLVCMVLYYEGMWKVCCFGVK